MIHIPAFEVCNVSRELRLWDHIRPPQSVLGQERTESGSQPKSLESQTEVTKLRVENSKL